MTTPTMLTPESMIAQVEPVVRQHAAAAEAERRLPPEVMNALIDAGMFRTWVPRAYGGLEMVAVPALHMFEELTRIDSATGPGEWARDPDGNTKRIAATFREACDIAAGYGERLAAEGEICWGGMHSWKRMVQLLELVDRPTTIGFQADMAHTLLFTMGYNAPEDRLLPADYDWKDGAQFDAALRPRKTW